MKQIITSLLCKPVSHVMLGISALVLASAAGQASANYAEHEQTKQFIAEMVKDHGFDAAALKQLFSGAERKESILTAIARPAEKRLEWDKYQDIFLTEARISQGKSFMKDHAQTLARAEEKYGVPPHIIAAIIGVETFYGTRKGSFRVLDALATLGFDYPPRAAFFRKELGQFLLLAREQGFDPTKLEGSYAGAMGYGQFIPSSYRNFAVDFDGDKVADLFHNVQDAIGSVANYFAKHHWRRNDPVAYPLTLSGDGWKPLVATSLKAEHTVADLKKAGIQVPAHLSDKSAARLQHLVGKAGDEYWLTLHNFYVITRYNHSHLYAMAVYQLSEKLRHP